MDLTVPRGETLDLSKDGDGVTGSADDTGLLHNLLLESLNRIVGGRFT